MLCVCVYVSVFVCVCVYVCGCVCVYVCGCMFVYICVCACVCFFKFVMFCGCVCTCECLCLCDSISIRIYTKVNADFLAFVCANTLELLELLWDLCLHVYVQMNFDFMYKYMCIHIFMYISKLVCIYTSIFTYMYMHIKAGFVYSNPSHTHVQTCLKCLNTKKLTKHTNTHRHTPTPKNTHK